jgi:hypothetical protein
MAEAAHVAAAVSGYSLSYCSVRTHSIVAVDNEHSRRQFLHHGG